MARRATIQLKVHRQIVQSIPLDDADVECLIEGLRPVTPCTQRIDRPRQIYTGATKRAYLPMEQRK